MSRGIKETPRALSGPSRVIDDLRISRSACVYKYFMHSYGISKCVLSVPGQITTTAGKMKPVCALSNRKLEVKKLCRVSCGKVCVCAVGVTDVCLCSSCFCLRVFSCVRALVSTIACSSVYFLLYKQHCIRVMYLLTT